MSLPIKIVLRAGAMLTVCCFVHGASLAAAEKPDTGASESKAEVQAGVMGGFLVLPIFITEPAIGEGLGATLIYFHERPSADQPRASTGREISRTAEQSKPPPTATGLFGFYTNDDSAAVGIGHSHSFGDDEYRLLAATAEARINSSLYILDQPLSFTLEGNLLYAQLKRRLSRTGAFIGLSLSYLDAESRFGASLPGFDDIDLLRSDFDDAGLSFNLSFDTRDNTMLPASGFLAEMAVWRYDEGIGGDFNYRKNRLKGLYFMPFARDYVLGLRADLSAADGGVPFYAAPFVDLRGIPALRYQGRAAGAVEAEVRRRIGDRWSASLFTGEGYVDSGFGYGKTDDRIRSFGIGLRYLALPSQDAWVGLDVARGPEDTAWYVQMGSSW